MNVSQQSYRYRYIVRAASVWQKVKKILATYKLEKEPAVKRTFFSSPSQTMRGRGGEERVEAELQHIPAKAVSNDVTARKNKEERKQKSGDKKTGLDKINMNVTQDTCTHLVPKLHTQGHTHTHTTNCQLHCHTQ